MKEVLCKWCEIAMHPYEKDTDYTHGIFYRCSKCNRKKWVPKTGSVPSIRKVPISPPRVVEDDAPTVRDKKRIEEPADSKAPMTVPIMSLDYEEDNKVSNPIEHSNIFVRIRNWFLILLYRLGIKR
jgi:hypothetical protein